ncbi:MAG: hypothetical protein A2X94_05865 [Bdellovibrionales bacterium GWB1_55_8]|nr:MAG: hypothetical protein A2X94_05865 [Bdellovibrionales bacterium GWB1_55_8]
MSFRAVTRAILIFLIPAIPLSALGALIGGGIGALVGATVAVTGILLLGFYSEALLIRAHSATMELPLGLPKTLECACACSALPIPRLTIFPGATPTALAIRGFRGNGIVILSQGMVALLPEEQLRAVLKKAAKELREPGLSVRSLAAVLSLAVLRAFPDAWADVFFADQRIDAKASRRLTPGMALGFLLLFPLLRTFLRLSSARGIAHSSEDDFFDQAARVVNRHCLPPGSSRVELSVRPLSIVPAHPVGQLPLV